MRYQVLACDYDGTIAHHGRVADATVEALQRFLASGRRLVMVTGRELPDLLEIFPRLDLFEWVVAENGALLYRPGTRQETLLGPAPPEKFVQRLRQRNVKPLSVGKVIVATEEPHEKEVLEAVRDLGLELHVIFNKGSVMVLPSGVNKATGLAAALKEMRLSAHNVVGVGDAENDHAFLQSCECAVAVANALPTVQQEADFVTKGPHGVGVVELIDEMIADDLRGRDARLTRHRLPLGKTADGDRDVLLAPFGPAMLIAGPSASGKSTVATGFVETLVEHRYQFCVIDPEGDYESFEGCVVLGGPRRPPSVEEVLKLLDNPAENVVVSLTGVPIADRPPLFLELMTHLLQMRSRTGRPHWLVLDEAHHLIPAAWEPPGGVLPEALTSVLLITVHPDLLAVPVLQRIDTVLAVGKDAEATLQQFAQSAGAPLRPFQSPALEPGEVLLWSRENPDPQHLKAKPSHSERRRHRRKYAEGNLPPERSFFFQGPEGKLNLRAQNLMLFLQMAEGVDDATWEHHLRKGDYSRWFREGIKDESLAAEAERIEKLPRQVAAETRALIKAAIERDYTLPASPPMPVEGAS